MLLVTIECLIKLVRVDLWVVLALPHGTAQGSLNLSRRLESTHALLLEPALEFNLVSMCNIVLFKRVFPAYYKHARALSDIVLRVT